MRYLLLMGVVLMAAGMFFKVAAFRFTCGPRCLRRRAHVDTAFMSVCVKAASFAMFGDCSFTVSDLRGTMAGDAAANIPGLPGWAVLVE